MIVDHLSYSSIAMYLTCAASWRFKYVDKLPVVKSPDLVFGNAFHGTIEQYIKTSHDDVDIASIWMEQWNKQLVSHDNEIDWGTDTPEMHCNDGLRMLTTPDIVKGLKSINATEIEKKVELRIPGVPVPIIGYIDCIERDGVPGDFKTSRSSWTWEKAANETQPLFYLSALYHAGILDHQLRFRHYIFVKTKTARFQIYEHQHYFNELAWLTRMITNVWLGISKGMFPENPTTWKCSSQYCEYWRDWRGKNA